MDWKECCQKRIVKDVTRDTQMILSLAKTSSNKAISESQLPLNETTASSKLSLAYDSLRELLEALALHKGYKIYNHECYTSFLKEMMMQSNKGDDFDEIRKVRNSVNYYGKDISVEETDKFIAQIKELRAFVIGLLGKDYPNTFK